MNYLYTVFHFNLAYSSIEEDQRREVLNSCYWPLLQLAGALKIPFGLEASGYTLETAAEIDPVWVNALQDLVTNGPCEFVGSGYAQLIGPLVPARVNAANLRLGNEVYERLLGLRPEVGLVNEQAYSAGLVQHYLDAGYRAIVMEWNNPARFHSEWEQKWRYLPQYACDQYGQKIPLLWNDSIAFQKFQRYAHGDIELTEQMEYLKSHLGSHSRVFSLYGNDVEIFDYRPGRYHTEAVLSKEGEWNRIRVLLEELLNNKSFAFIRPKEALGFLNEPGAGNLLHLESAEQPVPVKKQGKYNISRWAVTGRNDLGINTACRQLYEAIKNNPAAPDDYWRELCFLWSSDYRTHITERRWKAYLKRLEAFQQAVGVSIDPSGTQESGCLNSPKASKGDKPVVSRQGRFLYVETGLLKLKLNCKKGLAIDGLWLGDKDSAYCLGTLDHGFYDDIALGADWFSGHVVLELMGHPKITDLEAVEPALEHDQDTNELKIGTSMPTAFGTIKKNITVAAEKPRLTLQYVFEWDRLPFGSIRLGHLTLNPDAFDRNTLFYRTCNGGRQPEKYNLAGKNINHGSAVSFLVSASGGLGITGGWVEIGDANFVLRVDIDKSASAMLGLINYQEAGEKYFYRLSFSAGEMDDTCSFGENNKGRSESTTLVLGWREYE